MKSFLLIIVLVLCHTDALVRYDNYQVCRVIPKSVQELEILQQLQERPKGLDFWTEPFAVNRSVDIMVPPRLQRSFSEAMSMQEIELQVAVDNVQKLIDEEKAENELERSSKFGWKNYHTLEEIYEFLDLLEKKFPKYVKVIVGGKSYEGRPIKGVKVSFGPGKKAAFIEGGIHAREWISPAVVTFLLYELLYNSDARNHWAPKRDWYVFPVLNPDGYVYSHEHDRMWRKTRKPYGKCVGADPNRNWDYHWMDGGASSDPCHETFAGSSAFSEIETKSMSEFLNRIGGNLDTYLAFHSYSQVLLIPFGHKGHEVPKNNAELFELGRDMLTRLFARNGTEYDLGNIPDVMYTASGSSMDWAVGTHRNIRYPFTFELRPGRSGFPGGFCLPPKYIIVTALETLDAVFGLFGTRNE